MLLFVFVFGKKQNKNRQVEEQSLIQQFCAISVFKKAWVLRSLRWWEQRKTFVLVCAAYNRQNWLGTHFHIITADSGRDCHRWVRWSPR